MRRKKPIFLKEVPASTSNGATRLEREVGGKKKGGEAETVKVPRKPQFLNEKADGLSGSPRKWWY